MKHFKKVTMSSRNSARQDFGDLHNVKCVSKHFLVWNTHENILVLGTIQNT